VEELIINFGIQSNNHLFTDYFKAKDKLKVSKQYKLITYKKLSKGNTINLRGFLL